MLTVECTRLAERRQAFLDAASALFVEQGFERTTLADIVERAGGSLATLYKLFGNKDGLLKAVVFARMEAGDALVNAVARRQLSPCATLQTIAEEMHECYLDRESLALFRVVLAHSIADQAFARTFFDHTTRSAQTALGDLFASYRARGIGLVGAPDLLADTFMALLVNDFRTAALSHGAAGRQSAEALAARTAFFLRGAGLVAA